MSKKSSLRSRTIRLASENKALRPHLLKVLKACEGDIMGCGPEADGMAGRTWGKPDLYGGGKGSPNAPRDDHKAPGYHSHSGHPPAGCNKGGQPGCEGTYEQRKTYNNWFRKNVCPGHQYKCDRSKGKGPS
jgi:hypothetical protein